MGRLISSLMGKAVEVIPLEETYFMAVSKPAAKITKNIIQLNYAAYSPYPNGDVIYFVDGNKLYLWFTISQSFGKIMTLPEGFLLFKTYKTAKDTIIIKKKGGNTAFLVVKNGVLESQILKKNEVDVPRFLSLLTREYSLVSPAVVNANGPLSIKDVGIKNALMFIPNLDLTPRTLFKGVLDMITVPMIVLLLILNVGDFATFIYFNHLYKHETTVLSSLRHQTEPLKKRLNYLKTQKFYWDNFKKVEFNYPGPWLTLNVLAESLRKCHGSIVLFSQSGNAIHLRVVSSSTPILVENLMKTGYFEDIKVLSISQDRSNKKKEFANLEIKLKAWR